MACIFNTVLLDLSAAMTDSFDGRGAYSRGGGLIGGFMVGNYFYFKNLDRFLVVSWLVWGTVQFPYRA